MPLMVGSANIELVPELASLQFVNKPKEPLDLLPRPQRDKVLTQFAMKVSAALDSSRLGNGLRVIDSLAYRASGFGGTAPGDRAPGTFGTVVRQGQQGLTAGAGSQARTILDFDRISALPPDARQLIRAYDLSIRDNLERYTDAYAKRGTFDKELRREAERTATTARQDLCGDLNKLLDFLASLGVCLDDHYMAVRHICTATAPVT
jgi:hypothetical protein